MLLVNSFNFFSISNIIFYCARSFLCSVHSLSTASLQTDFSVHIFLCSSISFNLYSDVFEWCSWGAATKVSPFSNLYWRCEANMMLVRSKSLFSCVLYSSYSWMKCFSSFFKSLFKQGFKTERPVRYTFINLAKFWKYSGPFLLSNEETKDPKFYFWHLGSFGV